MQELSKESPRVLHVYNEGNTVQQNLLWPSQWTRVPVELALVESGLPTIEASLQSIEAALQTVAEHAADELCALYIPAHLRLFEFPQAAQCGGLQLLKHLRLSRRYTNAAVTPVLIGLEGQLENYVRRETDNVILLSPGCRALALPALGREWKRALDGVERFEGDGVLQQMRESVQPYIVFDESNRAQQLHFLRNQAGVGKFLQEFAAGNLPPDDLIIKEKQDLAESQLWLKKMLLHDAETGVGPVVSFDAEFHQECLDSRFVLIDDQFHIGWAYGLYAGLFLSPPEAQTEAGRAELLDSLARINKRTHDHAYLIKDKKARMICCKDEGTAKRYFAHLARVPFELAIAHWQKAEEVLFDEDNSHHWQNNSDDVEQAKQKVLQTAIESVVFLDLRLGSEDEGRPLEETTGIRLLQELKTDFPYLPVVMMTASQKALSLQQARALGADGYWVKGESSGEQLVATIQRCLKLAKLTTLWKKFRMIEQKTVIRRVSYDWYNFQPECKPRPPKWRIREIYQQEDAGGGLASDENASEESDSADHFEEIISALRLALELMRLTINSEEDGAAYADSLASAVLVQVALIQERRIYGLMNATKYAGDCANWAGFKIRKHHSYQEKETIKAQRADEITQRLLGVSFDENEQMIQKLRGASVHQNTQQKVSCDEAFYWLDYTLDWLLTNW